jgi:hypothetical protein
MMSTPIVPRFQPHHDARPCAEDGWQNDKGEPLDVGHPIKPRRIRRAHECSASASNIQAALPITIADSLTVPLPAYKAAVIGANTPTAMQAVDARSSALAISFLRSL